MDRNVVAERVVALAKELVASPVVVKYKARYNQWSGGRQANISVDVDVRFADADVTELSTAIKKAETTIGEIASAIGAKNNEWYQDEGWSADTGMLFATYQIEPREMNAESIPDVFKKHNIPLTGDFMDD